MIERFRLWLGDWLCIGLLRRIVQTKTDNLQSQIDELRAEVARLKVEFYIPPQPEELKPKVIQTRTMREYNAILEREFEHEEA